MWSKEIDETGRERGQGWAYRRGGCAGALRIWRFLNAVGAICMRCVIHGEGMIALYNEHEHFEFLADKQAIDSSL